MWRKFGNVLNKTYSTKFASYFVFHWIKMFWSLLLLRWATWSQGFMFQVILENVILCYKGTCDFLNINRFEYTNCRHIGTFMWQSSCSILFYKNCELFTKYSFIFLLTQDFPLKFDLNVNLYVCKDQKSLDDDAYVALSTIT